jgi:hypothetical protein
MGNGYPWHEKKRAFRKQVNHHEKLNTARSIAVPINNSGSNSTTTKYELSVRKHQRLPGHCDQQSVSHMGTTSGLQFVAVLFDQLEWCVVVHFN